jgi:hypothetical protein
LPQNRTCWKQLSYAFFTHLFNRAKLWVLLLMLSK